MGELTIACALVGTKWSDVWVYRMYEMLRDTQHYDFDFKVITDRPEAFPEWGVPFSRAIKWTDQHHSKIRDSSTLWMNRDKPQGCWAKLDFFLLDGPVIGLDLDIVVLDDLRPLIRDTLHMAYDGKKCNGSVYSFNGPLPELCPERLPFSSRQRGEQEWVEDTGNAKALPDCYSYKLQVASRRGQQPPPGARIVFFHGRPDPSEVSVDWVNRTWKGLERSARV